jgi:hypothetical protein
MDGGWRFGRVESGRSSDGLRSVEVEIPKVDMEDIPVSSSSDSEPLEDLSRRGGRASPGAIVLFGGGSTPVLLVPSAEVSFVEWEQDARAVERRAIELILAFGKLVSVL